MRVYISHEGCIRREAHIKLQLRCLQTAEGTSWRTKKTPEGGTDPRRLIPEAISGWRRPSPPSARPPPGGCPLLTGKEGGHKMAAAAHAQGGRRQQRARSERGSGRLSRRPVSARRAASGPAPPVPDVMAAGAGG